MIDCMLEGMNEGDMATTTSCLSRSRFYEESVEEYIPVEERERTQRQKEENEETKRGKKAIHASNTHTKVQY
jgi:hypothetical protein